MNQGPLAGIRVVEIEAIGPVPLAGMLLADLGADVVRIERTTPSGIGIARPPEFDYALRGRSVLRADLKSDSGKALVLDLTTEADALIEGFRPGVMERLGLGPEVCCAANSRLVYGRLTGWGQDGPLARTAGHDINYLALTGVLDRLGPEGAVPHPPVNLLGDYAGGSMLMVVGLLAGILAARGTGQGQVVDAAMIDGIALLATPLMGLIDAGVHAAPRGGNLLDGGAPHYGVYICQDGLPIAIGAIERKFFAEVLAGLELDPAQFPDPDDTASWPLGKKIIADRLAMQPRAHWLSRFEDTDACVTPVLTFAEAMRHPHHLARAGHQSLAGHMQPAPAPRFSATPANMPTGLQDDSTSAADILARWQGGSKGTT